MDSETIFTASSSAPPTPKQERSQRTRQELIYAAREIFARDGFSSARLQDISALAGKTRGAFYAHFQNKEDVFFAIFEQDMERDEGLFAERLRAASTTGDRIDIVVDHLAEVLRDDRRMLLELEFKMYALRHANGERRLADLHAAMCLAEPGDQWHTILPELCAPERDVQRVMAAQINALLDGLALTRMFDPHTMDDQTMRRQLRAGIAAIMLPTGA